MLTYDLLKGEGGSLYENLYKAVRNDIEKGVLKADEKLPSKRNFAKNLGVSVITVENAYNQLLAEGYIYSRARSGFYVSRLIGISTEPHHRSDLSELDLYSEPEENTYIDLTGNANNYENFPFATWSRLMREVMNENSRELMVNAQPGGTWDLRQAISRYLMEFRAIEVKPGQIIVGAGTEYLYGLLVQILGHNTKYAVENPGYKKVYKIIKCNNADCVYVDMDSHGINMKKLYESGADVVHISPSHHFPTGIVTPVRRRYELLKWAQESENRYIIEDDYDSEFRFMGKPIPPMKSIDTAGKVIYINTFTKSLASTIRISYMILPEKLMDIFNSRLGFYSCTVSNFEQYTLARFIKSGYFEKHINRMRTTYRKKRNKFLDEIKKSRIKDYVTVMEEESGLHFLMKVNVKISDEELVQKAENEGIKLVCLSQYYYEKIPSDSDKNHIMVINYAGIPDQKLREIIDKISDIILNSQ